MIAQVVFNLPLDRPFDYAVPAEFAECLKPGARVLAPFGPRRLIGYVISLKSTSAFAHPKSLLRLIDDAPLLQPDQLRLAGWLSQRYYCSFGEACAAILPTALRLRATGAAPSTKLTFDSSIVVVSRSSRRPRTIVFEIGSIRET